MAHYYISGVYKNEKDDVTHVLLHLDAGHHKFYNGIKETAKTVMEMLDSGDTIQVISWNYSSAHWYVQDFVKVVNGKKKYLRSHKNGVITDNLDNLVNLAGIV